MGRFTAKAVTIRELRNGIKIYFIDSKTIYVENLDGFYYIFHRWDVKQRNYYSKNWHIFYINMKQRQTLDIYKIYKLANKFDISRSITVKPPQLENKEVREI